MSVVVMGAGIEMLIPGTKYRVAEDLEGNKYLRIDGAFTEQYFPLRPLPEKHGRLIDADDYAAEMKERQADAMLWKEKAARNNDMTTFARGDQAMRTFSEAKLTLDNMETIVEAEGE